MVRIGLGPTMPREMLAAGPHPGLSQPFDQRSGELNDNRRIAVKRSRADRAATPPVEVEYRREGQVDTVQAELGREDEADAARSFDRFRGIGFPPRAKAAHGR